LLVEGTGQPTILGRQTQGTPVPGMVDLSKYQAHLLGVSRQHAAISFTDSTFTIEDLNSSNGTWVNENRIEPKQPRTLRNGDVIRLGQLIIFVYLH
ncbi:MAG: FHA domain-containing protein, partial [Acidobacteriales bacterium]|nr:FHA domain-containing protein [Terriglobales bacterium]